MFFEDSDSSNIILSDCSSGSQVPFDEMSIHRLANLQDDKAGNILRKILQGLEFPSYLAPEELFSKVKEHKDLGLHVYTYQLSCYYWKIEN